MKQLLQVLDQSEQPAQSSEEEEEHQDGEAVKKEEPMQSSEDEEPDGAPVKMEQPVQNSEEEHDQGEADNTFCMRRTLPRTVNQKKARICVQGPNVGNFLIRPRS